MHIIGCITQLVEWWIFNPQVLSSNLNAPIASLVELVDTIDSKSIAACLQVQVLHEAYNIFNCAILAKDH